MWPINAHPIGEIERPLSDAASFTKLRTPLEKMQATMTRRVLTSTLFAAALMAAPLAGIGLLGGQRIPLGFALTLGTFVTLAEANVE